MRCTCNSQTKPAGHQVATGHKLIANTNTIYSIPHACSTWGYRPTSTVWPPQGDTTRMQHQTCKKGCPKITQRFTARTFTECLHHNSSKAWTKNPVSNWSLVHGACIPQSSKLRLFKLRCCKKPASILSKIQVKVGCLEVLVLPGFN